MKLFVSPHNDDEALFGSLTLLREQPLVVIVFDSHVQQSRGLDVTWEQRRQESVNACEVLGCQVCFLGFRDDDPNVTERQIRQKVEAFHPHRIWAPAHEVGGHPQHNLVALACSTFRYLTQYKTYTELGKTEHGRRVLVQDPTWIPKKLKALTCYESQFNLDPRMGCWPHFLRDQTEYYA